MEQKTIGKFIAALRHANGYTQRELADKLCVSDKAVSRWERDECAPDLTLLPVIAEIFGITTDELLRGERNSPDRPTEQTHTAAKSGKQLKNIIRQKQIRYRNLTVISMGIALVGLIAAMICNFGFLRARIGLLVGSVFYLAAAVCQICFANLSLSDPSDEEESFAARLRELNLEIVRSTRNVMLIIAAIFVANLPLAMVYDTYMGLKAGSWLASGLVFETIFVLVAYLCHLFFLDSLILKKAAPMIGDSYTHPETDKKVRRLFWRMMLIALAGAILPTAAGIAVVSLDQTLFVEGTEHTSLEEFKTFMEQKINYYDDTGSYVNANGDSFYVVEIEGETQVGVESPSNSHTLSKDETVLLEFEWNNLTVSRIEVNEDSADGLPIRTYERFDIQQANDIQEALSILCALLVVAETAVCLIIFFVKQRKLK